MAWQYIQYEYPVPYIFDKVLMWLSVNCNCYFALRERGSDSWSYFSAYMSHSLGDGYRLVKYTTEASAQSNYLRTSRDSDGKVIAVLPLHFLAKYVRVYIDDSIQVNVREFRPSTLTLADEIIAGDLSITDDFINPPLIRVSKSGSDRIKIGNFEGSTFGIIGYDDEGNVIFELSDENKTIGGWDFNTSSLTSGNVIIDSENQCIKSANYIPGTFGSGFFLGPDLLEVGNIASRGIIRTAVFQKDTISAISGNIFISKGADTIVSDLSPAEYTVIEIEGNDTFEVNDVLRIKEGTSDEWLKVVATGLYKIEDDNGALWGPEYHGISFKDNQAFIRVQGVDLSSYDSNYLFYIADSDNNPALAFLDGADVGLTLGTNLITNSGFETFSGTRDDGNSDTFTGWTVNDTDDDNGDTVEATSIRSVGSTALKIVKSSDNGIPYVDRSISVVAGKLYQFSFKTRGDGNNSLAYSIEDVTNEEDVISIRSAEVVGTSYTEKIVYFTAPLGCILVRIRFQIAE